MQCIQTAFVLELAISSSLTGSHHSLRQSSPGTSTAICENQLSALAPCQCLTRREERRVDVQPAEIGEVVAADALARVWLVPEERAARINDDLIAVGVGIAGKRLMTERRVLRLEGSGARHLQLCRHAPADAARRGEPRRACCNTPARRAAARSWRSRCARPPRSSYVRLHRVSS